MTMFLYQVNDLYKTTVSKFKTLYFGVQYGQHANRIRVKAIEGSMRPG